MYFVNFFDSLKNKWVYINSFVSYDKALYFVKYNNYMYNIPLADMQIVHKGLAYNITEDSLKSVKPFFYR